jgi:ATP-binding protein involved in chromosome partitioning
VSAFECDHGESYALLGEGGGVNWPTPSMRHSVVRIARRGWRRELADAFDAPLIGEIPLPPAVTPAGDAGDPVVPSSEGRAAAVFADIAEQITALVAPPANADEPDMAGCSALLFDTVNAALAELDADRD